jgi:hypothetical protein
MNKIIFLLLFIFAAQLAAAQKQSTSLSQIWIAYNNQTRFSNKWGTWTDLHLRTKENFFDNFSTSILRFGITYYLDDAAKLTAGYAYVTAYPADNHKNIARPEHRPWQQFQWHTKYGKKRLMQWIRLEERYRRKVVNESTLGDGYNFNFRLRYAMLLQVPLSKKGIVPNSLALVVNDEVHVNFGKEIVYNYFDQNRFFVGLGYQVNATDNLQVGYMYLFQQLGAGNSYRHIHVPRIFYFHNLDLRKK